MFITLSIVENVILKPQSILERMRKRLKIGQTFSAVNRFQIGFQESLE